MSPIDGQTVLCQAARGDASDIGAAVDAATTTFNESWSKASVSERSNILLKIADIIEENLERLARIETADNGKAVRECLAADLPLVIDHFRCVLPPFGGRPQMQSRLDCRPSQAAARPDSLLASALPVSSVLAACSGYFSLATAPLLPTVATFPPTLAAAAPALPDTCATAIASPPPRHSSTGTSPE